MTELLSITPIIMTKAQAQEMIDSMEDTDYVLMGVVNYEKSKTVSEFRRIKKKKSKRIVDKAQTVIFMGDQQRVFSHLDLHSTFQDIKSIQPRGVIKTIMLPGV